MKTIRYIIFVLLFLLPLSKTMKAQDLLWRAAQRPIASYDSPFSLTEETHQTLTLTWRLGDVRIDTGHAPYFQLHIDGFESHTGDIGKPQLPAFHKLITLPEGTIANIEIQLDNAIPLPLPAECGLCFPTQPSQGKETEADFALDEALYTSNHYYGLPAVQLKELGTLRGQRLLLLTMIPIAYNPVTHTVLLHDSLQAHIRLHTTNKSLVQYHHGNLATDKPPVYMVVSVDSFRTALQPFIDWKRRQGYAVETLSAPAWQQETLRDALAKRYHASTSQQPAPSYLLLAGDVEQIPAWQGSAATDALGQHATDLYYAEYTGDHLPEVMMGRFSAQTIAQLQAIVHKTLAYEQLALNDTSYLNHALLVAGKEERHNSQLLTNGQVNYLKQALQESRPTLDTHCYYNPTSHDQRDNILATWQQGTGLVNYSAHCLVDGWQDPSVQHTDINNLPANGQYAIVVNNCCHSNNFRSDCFGEALLRKACGGAVGVIGATGETLWEEDYYWAVGIKRPFVLHPLYNPAAPGAYDRLLHRRYEPYYQHATTLGEMLLAGNIAVAAAGSPYADYYWEAYCLLGDPSLMPYIGIPDSLMLSLTETDGQPLSTTVSHETTLLQGTSQLAFRGTPYSRVAVACDTLLLGSCLLDSNGFGSMNLAMPILGDSLLLTATAQNHVPLLQTLATHRSNTARLVPQSYSLTNTAGETRQHITNGDTMYLHIRMVNTGTGVALHRPVQLVHAIADSLAGYRMQLHDSIQYIDTLLPDSTAIATFRLIVDADGVTALLPSLESTIATLSPSLPATAQHSEQTLLRQISLRCICGSDEERVQHSFALSVERPALMVTTARLLIANDDTPENNKAANLLLPGHHYWLQLVAANNSSSGSSRSRLCITQCNGAQVLTDACHAGIALAAQSRDTLYLPLRTHDTLRQLYLGITLECDNRPTEYPLYFLPDSAMERFEGSFLHFPWDTVTACPWQIDSTVSHNGLCAARSAPLAHRQRSDLHLTLQVNARDTLSFWVKCSSEANHDKLSFYIDDAHRHSWSGTRDWQRVQYVVQPGLRHLTWRYEKDESGEAGDDCVWLDDIRLPLSVWIVPTGYGDSVVAPVAIMPADTGNRILVYPNPCHGKITTANLGSTEVTLLLTDMMGLRHEEWLLPPYATTTHSLHHLPDGLYLVVAQHPSHTFIQKLLLIK